MEAYCLIFKMFNLTRCLVSRACYLHIHYVSFFLKKILYFLMAINLTILNHGVRKQKVDPNDQHLMCSVFVMLFIKAFFATGWCNYIYCLLILEKKQTCPCPTWSMFPLHEPFVVLMVPSMRATSQSPLLQCLGHPSSY